MCVYIMLSFDRGKPIALALNKDGHLVHTIRVTPDEKKSDIDVDTPIALIDAIDIEELRKMMRLGVLETRVLIKAITAGKSDGLNEKLARAYTILEEKANEKLKREIHFLGDDVATVIPVFGHERYDRSIALFGPSGAGKTFLAKQILVHDKKRRPVVLFSKVVDDASLHELTLLKAKDGKPRLIQIPLLTDEDIVSLPMDVDLQDTVAVFDDIDSLQGDRAQFLREYRDALLESGRHNNISIISTSHIMRGYNKTRVLLNECEWSVLFPNANRISADRYLHDGLGFDKLRRDTLIARASKSGRYMCVKMSTPSAMVHTKGIILL